MQIALRIALVLAAALAWSGLASAEPAAVRDQSPALAAVTGEQDLHFAGGFGMSHDRTLGDALAHSASVAYRWHYFEAGLTGDFGTHALGGQYAMTGVMAGATWQTTSGQRFSLSGVIGSDAYFGVGCELECRTATLPYAGLRASASHVLRSGSHLHLELGIVGFWGRDLETQQVVAVEMTRESRTLGGQRIGALATVGFLWDTTPERRTVAQR